MQNTTTPQIKAMIVINNPTNNGKDSVSFTLYNLGVAKAFEAVHTLPAATTIPVANANSLTLNHSDTHI